MVEELDLGLENRSFLLHHLQSDVSPATADFMGSDLQSAITGQGHHARLARAQVETFAAEQAVGGVVEHGLQFADVPFQLRIDHRAIARCQDGIHTDPTAFFGQQGFRGPVPGEHQYRKHQQQTGKSKPHFVHFPRPSLHGTREWFVAFRGFRKS